MEAQTNKVHTEVLTWPDYSKCSFLYFCSVLARACEAYATGSRCPQESSWWITALNSKDDVFPTLRDASTVLCTASLMISGNVLFYCSSKHQLTFTCSRYLSGFVFSAIIGRNLARRFTIPRTDLISDTFLGNGKLAMLQYSVGLP